MRRFTPEYLRDTRRGLWDDREILSPHFAGSPARILDVGAGTGEFTTVLREESGAEVLALDGDKRLLRTGSVPNAIQGGATRLPLSNDTVDLVTCQALLVNVPDPTAVLGEFARVSADRVGAVEPDNGAVSVESTVERESAVARRARSAYRAGLETNSRIGTDLKQLFLEQNFRDITVSRMDHERRIEPPYTANAIESARRKVRATRIDDHRETMLAGGLSPAEFDTLRDDWQAMGRSVVKQVKTDSYRRRETVPFYIATGRLPGA